MSNALPVKWISGEFRHASRRFKEPRKGHIRPSKEILDAGQDAGKSLSRSTPHQVQPLLISRCTELFADRASTIWDGVIPEVNQEVRFA